MNWSAERVLWICEITSISAGVLAVAALVGQVWAGRIVNQRQATELLQLKTDVAEQQARAANAEARLLELKTGWKRCSSP